MQDLKEVTSYRIALKGRILDASMKAFCEKGVKAVKMDDIASLLGISKRTLYELYDDKEKLLFQVMQKYAQQRHEHLRAFAADGHNVIDIIVEAYRLKVRETNTVCPQFYEDILKYPAIVDFIRKEHDQTRQNFLEFLKRGASEGCFRDDVDYTLVPHLMEAVGQYIIANKLLEKYTIEKLFRNMFLVPLRGLCTAKGQQLLDNVAFSKIR